MSTPFRRRPGEGVWHFNNECSAWPGGSFEGLSVLGAADVKCIECRERCRAAADYVPRLPTRTTDKLMVGDDSEIVC